LAADNREYAVPFRVTRRLVHTVELASAHNYLSCLLWSIQSALDSAARLVLRD
jgi:hypothetical protein